MWIPVDTPSLAYDEPRYTATEIILHASREELYDVINSNAILKSQLLAYKNGMGDAGQIKESNYFIEL